MKSTITLYRILIDGLDLTYENLIKYGISENEIKELLQNHIIVINKSSTFSLVSIAKFCNYGIELLLENRIVEADKCFQKCYELAPNGRKICLQALCSAVRRSDYKLAYEIFETLEQINPEKNILDNNIILYLLNIISPANEAYRARIRNLNNIDLQLPKRNSTKVEYEIRKAILLGKFKYAYQQTNIAIGKETGYSVKSELFKTLLYNIIEHEKQFRQTLAYLINTEQYKELDIILTERSQEMMQSTLEKNILLIINAINNILTTKAIPLPESNDANTVYEALTINNFKLALELNLKFLEEKGENPKTDLINILLVKLNKLIEQQDKDNRLNVIIDKETTEQEEKTLEDLAYYISNQNMSIDMAIKQFGILPEQALLIKLIYARDCYIDGDYENGDKFLEEVEKSLFLTSKVIASLKEVKTNRNNYHKQENVKRRAKQKETKN